MGPVFLSVKNTVSPAPTTEGVAGVWESKGDAGAPLSLRKRFSKLEALSFSWNSLSAKWERNISRMLLYRNAAYSPHSSMKQRAESSFVAGPSACALGTP